MSNWDDHGPIKGGDIFDVAGDSNSELAPNPWTEGGYPWYGNPGGLVDQIGAILPQSQSTPIPSTSAGARAINRAGGNWGKVGTTFIKKGINVSGFGTAGQTIVNAAINAVNLMANRIPVDAVSPVITAGWIINDIYEIAKGTGEVVGDIAAAVNTIFTQIYARWPGARVVWMGSFAFNEKHTDGPPASWGPGNDLGGTSNVDAVTTAANAALQAAVVANGGIFVDQHDGFLLPWEVINNPTNLLGDVAALQNGAGGAAVHYKLIAMTNVAAPAYLATVPVA